MSSIEVLVRATALGWRDDGFPGCVEVAILDSRRRQHRIVEKVAVLTSSTIPSNAVFPFELWVGAEERSVEGPEVRVVLKHGVETVEGARELVVASDNVVWP